MVHSVQYTCTLHIRVGRQTCRRVISVGGGRRMVRYDRAFAAAGLRLWNSQPTHVRRAPDLTWTVFIRNF